MKADGATIFMREDNTLTALMNLGVGEDTLENYTSYVGEGFEGKIVETKEHLFVQNAQEDPVVVNPYVARTGIHSMLGVPLLYGGEAIGVLRVDWLKEHLFSELELELLTVAGERCASAIAIAKMCEVNMELNKQTNMYFEIIEHDFNDLNTIMLSDLETVLSVPGLDADAKDTIEGVMADVNESVTVVGNVRKLHQTLNQELPIETMDLDEILTGALDEAIGSDPEKAWVHYSPETGRAVNGNELLKEVFYTLISNAVNCSRGPVTLDVNVEKVILDMQPYYTVSVVDNSQAIPDDVKPEVFTYHMGLTHSYGKVLPLFLVKLIIDRMDGDIKVEDRVPGDYKQGSEFIVTLPAIEGSVIPETEPTYP